jgi:signal peptidase II
MPKYKDIKFVLADIFIISVFVIFLDQWTKWIISLNLQIHQYIPVIKGFFNIVYATNTGAAFSILADSGELGSVFFKVITIVVLILLFFNLYKAPNRDVYLVIATGLITGGALGNFIDRIKMGRVIDFLDFYLGSYHWPAFNVADCAITTGALFFALHYWFNKEIYK